MKSKDKLVTRFLGGCLIAVGLMSDIRQVLAGEETGIWKVPEPTGGVPIPIEDVIALSIRKWVVMPLFAGGVIAYAMAFWYKFGRHDTRRTKRMFRIGMACLLLAAAIWALLKYALHLWLEG